MDRADKVGAVAVMKNILFLIIFSLFSAVSVPGSAADSQTAPWVKTDYTEVRLISAVTSVGENKQIPLGLHFKLKDGWKIYWRSPGDAGFPPRLNWNGSTNLDKAAIQWPAPKRFSVLGFDTQGYKDEVVFPLQATLIQPGNELNAQMKLDYLACKEICIPYQTQLSLSLPSGPAKTSVHAHLINRFQALVPGDGKGLGIKIKNAFVKHSNTKPILLVSASSTLPFQSPDLFVEGSRDIQFGKPRISQSKSNTEAEFEVPIYGLKNFKGGLDALIKEPITVTLIDKTRGLEKRLNITKGPPSQANTPDTSNSFWQIILFALLGGLILNLMPCVLPVLSIKLLGVVSHGGKDAKHVRLSFIASAAGIIFTFLIIAAGLLLLKTAGMSIGWGIQFQHPWFLILMAVIVTFFACNLWGFYEISLPQWIANAGSHHGQAQGLGGHFSTGMLATLLATPCSAPFLGTAIGFALSQGALEIWIIFTALGVGLALPYLLIAVAPSLATRLPRPGAWMIYLRKILGFALLATAIWLLTVLQALIDTTATLISAAFLAAIIAILYIQRRQKSESALTSWKAVAVMTLFTFAAPLWLAKAPDSLSNQNKDLGDWVEFDENRIHKLVSQGMTVFVDVTADWCITCQVNKKLVLDSQSVSAYFSNKNVIKMRADWTRPSETIAKYLSKFGRYGIPFNIVYGPDKPTGVTLPELLTDASVINALEQAGGIASTSATASRKN
jgi:suppressor for copper-sensitivity B